MASTKQPDVPQHFPRLTVQLQTFRQRFCQDRQPTLHINQKAGKIILSGWRGKSWSVQSASHRFYHYWASKREFHRLHWIQPQSMQPWSVYFYKGTKDGNTSSARRGLDSSARHLMPCPVVRPPYQPWLWHHLVLFRVYCGPKFLTCCPSLQLVRSFLPRGLPNRWMWRLMLFPRWMIMLNAIDTLLTFIIVQFFMEPTGTMNKGRFKCDMWWCLTQCFVFFH